MTESDPRHLRWPPEKLFWALLEAPGWARRGVVPEGLFPALDDELPLPVESLHAICAPAGGAALLVCAALRADLAGLDGDVLSLSPSELPAFAAGRCEPAHLNLLVGEYEPRLVRRTRTRVRALALVTVLIAAGLVSVGLSRRGEAWRLDARAHRESARQILAAVVAPGIDPASEIDRLRRANQATRREKAPTDAALSLAAVLTGWPAQVSCAAHSIAVGQAGATLSLDVEGDPTPFLESLRPPAGWALDEPRLNTTESGARLSLRLRPQWGGERVNP